MICNEVIKQVDSIKYLGVTIDKKITWSQQVDKITLKTNRVRGCYIVTLNTVLEIPKKMLQNIYPANIRVSINYMFPYDDIS